jgi:hypothetical protein
VLNSANVFPRTIPFVLQTDLAFVEASLVSSLTEQLSRANYEGQAYKSGPRGVFMHTSATSIQHASMSYLEYRAGQRDVFGSEEMQQ